MCWPLKFYHPHSKVPKKGSRARVSHGQTIYYWILVFLGGNIFSWKSKKQSVVARSTAEAEYRAMASLTCELIWEKQFLQELNFCDI